MNWTFSHFHPLSLIYHNSSVWPSRQITNHIRIIFCFLQGFEHGKILCKLQCFWCSLNVLKCSDKNFSPDAEMYWVHSCTRAIRAVYNKNYIVDSALHINICAKLKRNRSHNSATTSASHTDKNENTKNFSSPMQGLTNVLVKKIQSFQKIFTKVKTRY